MDRRLWLAVALMLGIGTGCPTEWGMDGRIERAVGKDMRELRSPPCGEGQQEIKTEKDCVGKGCKTVCVDN